MKGRAWRRVNLVLGAALVGLLLGIAAQRGWWRERVGSGAAAVPSAGPVVPPRPEPDPAAAPLPTRAATPSTTPAPIRPPSPAAHGRPEGRWLLLPAAELEVLAAALSYASSTVADDCAPKGYPARHADRPGRVTTLVAGGPGSDVATVLVPGPVHHGRGRCLSVRLERSRERWFAKSDEERDDRDPMHPAPKSWTSHDEPDAGLNAEKLLLVRLVEDAVRASEGEDGTSFWVRHAAMTRVGDRWYGRALVSTHILSSTHGRYIWLFRYHSEHHSWDKAPGSLRATEHEQWPNKEHTIECVRSSPAAAAKAWGIPVDLPRRWAKDAEGAVEREDEAARSKTEAEDAQAERRDPPP